ncbi:ParA family protein [Domibacillus sp. A3M-37]|uniref:ParA family protein n=1 Tax=Domibacillus sp. A3M-37 TaxID=2962037 RepID=UPI0020B66413|nr:ParA family protein [Domibacillus sp. A3M-37]MCP3765054.1 ParA family protein [Domibacillus sp. A3M-37]
MAEIYAVSTNKGGAGKTSLVTNLAGAIVKQSDKKVLIIDTDGQGNTSIAFGLSPHEIEDTIYDVLLGIKEAKDVIIEVTEQLHVLPSNNDMNFLEFDILPNLQKYSDPFNLLKKAINSVRDEYDYIFLDTPPSMGLVAGNVLAVSDQVIIPFVPEMFAVSGLVRVIQAIEDFKGKVNPSLKVAGIVGMMVDSRTTLHSQMLQQARRYCLENDLVLYETIVPKSIRFANSTAYEGKPATWTDANNQIVSSYFELMKEVFEYGKTK